MGADRLPTAPRVQYGSSQLGSHHLPNVTAYCVGSAKRKCAHTGLKPKYKIWLSFFNVITFIALFLRGATQGNVTSQRERTVPEMTHAQPWLSSPTADPHSHDCYMNTSYSMHNTQSRLTVNDNDVVTSIATIGTFEAVVFFVAHSP